MKLKELVNLKPSLEKLIVQDLPIKIAYKLSKLVKRLNEEYVIYSKNKNNLFEKYGTKEKEKITVKPENMKQFKKDLEELLEIEVKMNIDKIKLSDLNTIKISTIDMTNLDILIEE